MREGLGKGRLALHETKDSGQLIVCSKLDKSRFYEQRSIANLTLCFARHNVVSEKCTILWKTVNGF